MKKYSILLGSAPEDFRQKKIEDMFDFLDSKKSAGDSIVTFANGISELMLEMVLDNSIKQLGEAVVESVETTTQQDREQKMRHCERSEAISETGDRDCFVANAPCNDANCHSELDSESIDTCHSRARHGNLALQEDCRVKPDNDRNGKPDNDTDGRINSILLYICTLQPAGEGEKSIWLGEEEIRRDVISHYQKVAMECGIDMQVVFDFGNEMVSEEELEYEKVCE